MRHSFNIKPNIIFDDLSDKLPAQFIFKPDFRIAPKELEIGRRLSKVPYHMILNANVNSKSKKKLNYTSALLIKRDLNKNTINQK